MQLLLAEKTVILQASFWYIQSFFTTGVYTTYGCWTLVHVGPDSHGTSKRSFVLNFWIFRFSLYLCNFFKYCTFFWNFWFVGQFSKYRYFSSMCNFLKFEIFLLEMLDIFEIFAISWNSGSGDWRTEFMHFFYMFRFLEVWNQCLGSMHNAAIPM